MLLRGEASEQQQQQVGRPQVATPVPSPLRSSAPRDMPALSSPPLRSSVGGSSPPRPEGGGGEEGGSEDSVYLQQKWVRHWIDKELHRSVTHSAVRYQSQSKAQISSPLPTGRQQLYLSRYEESTWQQVTSPSFPSSASSASGPSPPPPLPRHFASAAGRSSRPGGGEAPKTDLEPEALEIFPTTLFVDKNTGQAVTTSSGGVVTIGNNSSHSRSVRVEASPSVLMRGCAAGVKSQDLELQPYSSVRCVLCYAVL